MFGKPDNCNAVKMYETARTHKVDNSVLVIISVCNATVENLSILVDKVLYPIAGKPPSKIILEIC